MNDTLAADDTARQRQVQELADRDEITQLIYRLGVALDEGLFDDMRSILTEDATAKTPGGVAQGREASIAQARRNHTDEQAIQHVIGNVLIDLDGDQATVRANLIANFTTVSSPPEGSPAPQPRQAPEPGYAVGEVYRFRVRRTPEGWRLSEIEATPVWSTGTRPTPAPAPA